MGEIQTGCQSQLLILTVCNFPRQTISFSRTYPPDLQNKVAALSSLFNLKF